MFFKITTTTRTFLLLLSLKLFLHTCTKNCNKKYLNAVLAFNFFFFLMFIIVYFGVVTLMKCYFYAKTGKLQKNEYKYGFYINTMDINTVSISLELTFYFYA